MNVVLNYGLLEQTDEFKCIEDLRLVFIMLNNAFHSGFCECSFSSLPFLLRIFINFHISLFILVYYIAFFF